MRRGGGIGKGSVGAERECSVKMAGYEGFRERKEMESDEEGDGEGLGGKGVRRCLSDMYLVREELEGEKDGVLRGKDQASP